MHSSPDQPDSSCLPTHSVVTDSSGNNGHESEFCAANQAAIPALRTWMESDSWKQLHDYAAHIEEMREIEKRDLAAALHNEFGSALTALSMRLGMMERLVPTSSHMVEQWGKVQALLNTLAQSTRRTQNQLRPVSLDVLNIKTAIVEHLQEFEAEAKITCAFELPEQEVALDAVRSLALLRMLQEILANVSKHSRATKLEVALQSNEEKTTLVVADNGVGFDLHVCDLKKTHGVRSMQERTEYLGGVLHIVSGHGLGTKLHITLHHSLPHSHNGAKSDAA